VTLDWRSPWLLGRPSRQLRRICADAIMVYSRAERVFILEHYFASASFIAVHETFSNYCPDKEVPNNRAQTLETNLKDTESVYRYQLFIERQHMDARLLWHVLCNYDVYFRDFQLSQTISVPLFET
jgi:hypothetical protein